MATFIRFLLMLCSLFIAQSLWAQLDSAEVTFQVDLSGWAVAPEGIHIAGTFQNWNPSSTPLTEGADGVWSRTIKLPPGDIEFKYINGDAWGLEEFVSPACGVSDGMGGNNRVFQVGGNDTTIALHCFANCGQCTFSTFFQVDVSAYLDSFSVDSVYVSGTMNNWCDTCDQMYDTDGDGIYGRSLTLVKGEYQFLFSINGNMLEQFTSADTCTVSLGGEAYGPFVRTFSLKKFTVLDSFCWNSCAVCADMSTGIFPQQAAIDLQTYPNPAREGLYVEADFGEWEATILQLFTSDGQLVFQEYLRAQFLNTKIPTEKLPNGLYFLSLRNGQGILSKKIVVKN